MSSIEARLFIIALLFSMQEHEQALVDAITKLADITDGDSGKNPPPLCFYLAPSDYLDFREELAF